MNLCFINEVYNLPGHFRVHQWPEDIIKNEIGSICCSISGGYNNIFVRVIDENSEICKFEICDIADFYGEVNYPTDAIIMATISLEREKWKKLQYYISKKYNNDQMENRRIEHIKKYNEFLNHYIDDKKLEGFLTELTTDYINETFGDASNVFNIVNLMKEAKPHFIKSIFSHYSTISLAIHEETNDEEADEDYYDEGKLQYTLFFDYYPSLHKFSQMISNLSKGEYPNGDCLCGSDIQANNLKYGIKLYNYARSLINAN